MSTTTETRRIVRAYHSARTAGDLDAAAVHLAPAFIFESPLMRLEGSAVYLESQRRFHQLVTGLDVISELYRDGQATLVYDLHTATPAGTQRTAELFRLDAGRIASILIVFDASPWRPIMGALTPEGPTVP